MQVHVAAIEFGSEVFAEEDLHYRSKASILRYTIE